MHVGIQEIVLIVLSVAVTTFMARRSHRPWLIGIPIQVAVVSICTPADPVSTLVIYLPCCVMYASGVLKSGTKPEIVA